LEKAAERIPWPVYVAGDAQRPVDATTATTLSACRLLGKVDSSQMAYWMGNAAVYALPALYEPFGLSVLEAAIAGCALVLGDIPSLRELWNEAAVFVNPRDDGAIASAIRGLMEDQGWRLLMGAKARQRAAEYSATKMVANYLSIYAALAGAGRRSSPAATV
jgi:glycosyltransferase involved in cell wall biosynthesis